MRMTPENRAKIIEYLDSKAFDIGVSTPGSTNYVWKVPVIGHLVAIEMIDGRENVRTVPLIHPELDFEGEETPALYEGESAKFVLPPIEGEYVIRAIVPTNATMDDVLSETDYDTEVCTLIHFVPGICTPDWRDELKKRFFSGMRDD